MRLITLKMERRTELVTEVLARLRGSKTEFEIQATAGAEEYDLQEPLTSEIGAWFEVAIKIIGGTTAALKLKKLILEVFGRHSSEADARPELYLIVGGQEYNTANLSEDELQALLKRE